MDLVILYLWAVFEHPKKLNPRQEALVKINVENQMNIKIINNCNHSEHTASSKDLSVTNEDISQKNKKISPEGQVIEKM